MVVSDFPPQKMGRYLVGMFAVCPPSMVMSQNTGALAFRKEDTVRGACAPTWATPMDSFGKAGWVDLGQQAAILFGIYLNFEVLVESLSHCWANVSGGCLPLRKT